MKKIVFILLICFSVIASLSYSMNSLSHQNEKLNDNLQSNDFNYLVPDEATAKRIAEIIWIRKYGEKKIVKQRPYKAILIDGVWIVKGIYPYEDDSLYDEFVGVACIEIQARDCKILEVWHTLGDE